MEVFPSHFFVRGHIFSPQRFWLILFGDACRSWQTGGTVTMKHWRYTTKCMKQARHPSNKLKGKRNKTRESVWEEGSMNGNIRFSLGLIRPRTERERQKGQVKQNKDTEWKCGQDHNTTWIGRFGFVGLFKMRKHPPDRGHPTSTRSSCPVIGRIKASANLVRHIRTASFIVQSCRIAQWRTTKVI